ncbi:hypothetical protein [Pediococcus pentosaceus]|uniref:hypothetical protein n=1 Tax=Pediococcus pentosaceus TaxID=1255 RepID=UPI003982BC11
MNYFTDYEEVVDAIISRQISSVDEFLRRLKLHVEYLNDYEIEQKWLDNQIEATFYLRDRVILLLMDLPPLVSLKATLHESGHILLGHQGNYLLSSMPVSGNNIEHAANMVSYALISWFYLCDHADEYHQVYTGLQDMANAYKIPRDDFEYFKEAYKFVLSKSVNTQIFG